MHLFSKLLIYGAKKMIIPIFLLSQAPYIFKKI